MLVWAKKRGELHPGAFQVAEINQQNKKKNI
jgi:hypothetical protein